MKQMTKSTRWVVPILLAVVAVVGCFLLRNREECALLETGGYCMVAEDPDGLTPYIHFYREDGKLRFRSSMDKRISRIIDGEVKIQNGKVYTTSEDGSQVWVFRLLDRETLEYVKEESTAVTDRAGKEIATDGTVFRWEG